MYRVYDKQNKKWVKEDVYLSPNESLFMSTRVSFGRYKMFMESGLYTYQYDIGAYDKESRLIFEGDILQSASGKIGLVCYVPEKSAYVLMDYIEYKYYPLGTQVCRNLKIIGNVFDTPDILSEDYKIVRRYLKFE